MRRAHLLVVALPLLAALACAGAPGPAGDGQLACWPRFPYQDGWLGGDGAYSIPLSPTRSLWLFGDTFVGRPGQVDREGARLVHNSAGVSECRDGRFTIRYAWRDAGDGGPGDLLPRPDGGGWWWLFGGFVHEGRLYLGLLEVERSAPRGPLALPFRHTGSSLARIDDPTGDPRRWRAQVLPLARGAGAHPLSAFAIHGPHLYLFAFHDREDGRHPRFLARLPLAALDARPADLPAALETWSAAGWLAGFRPDAALVLMDDDATEMSVRHHAASDRWVALYSFPEARGPFPEHPLSDAVHARSAPALEGPWSEPRPVFRIPELGPDAATRDPNTGCYAAKEQPQFSRPGSITFTYVCNLFTGPGEDPYAVLGRLQHAMGIYRPVAATVTLPDPAPAPAKPMDRAGAEP